MSISIPASQSASLGNALRGPGDLTLMEGWKGDNAAARPVTWDVKDQVPFALAGLQNALETFADTYDGIQANDFALKTQKKVDAFLTDPQSGAFNTRQGSSAEGLYQDWQGMEAQIWDKDAEGLTDRQRHMALPTIHRIFRDTRFKVGNFEAEQRLAGAEQQAQVLANQALNMAAGGDIYDDNRTMLLLDSLESSFAEQGRLKGWDAEYTKLQFESARSELLTGLAAAYAAKDPVAARGFLRSNKELVLPTMFNRADKELFKAHMATLEAQDPAFGLAAVKAALGQGNTDAPRGIRNNNPGNIIKTESSWSGEVEGSDGRFKTFASPEAGIAAIGKNLLSYDAKGINTVKSIITRWAPPSENDTGAYVRQVASALGVNPDEKLELKNPQVMTALASAIIKHENGQNPYSPEQIEAGVGAALEGGQTAPPLSAVSAQAAQLREVFTTAELLEYQQVYGKVVKERRKLAEDEVVTSTFQALVARVKPYSPDMQDLMAAQEIAELPTGEVKNRVRNAWEAEKKARDELISSRDAALATAFMDDMRKNNLSGPAALQVLPNLRENGMSSKGIDLLRQRLEKGEIDKETESNISSANDGYRMIDDGLITAPEQVDVLAFRGNLTKKQADGLKEYLAFGGQRGAASKLWSKVDKAYKNMIPGSKGLEKDKGFITRFLESADMEKLRRDGDDYIHKHTVNLLTVEGKDKDGYFFTPSVTLDKAVQMGMTETWLPNVSPEEERRITSMLQSMGQSHPDKESWKRAIQEYKKYVIMGVPRPKSGKGGR